ncbi:hypothetical protein DFH07DRAFT_969296 [Mycena maculata]|uniref:BTB domain-containing protein n=1 Tax=Mycena maculata TaxID=230809 RepID=A0AAD7HXS5_9AGAR|nr:hypothetical protein DFH07DRAFT_969296 [Mycena maculata]
MPIGMHIRLGPRLLHLTCMSLDALYKLSESSLLTLSAPFTPIVSMSTPQISVAQSERFCAPDADITISSSDGVLFKLHRKNLELHSDIFADAANATLPGNDSDITELPERADVLDLLFQYMYRQPQPDLRMVDFDLCARLAEAAEKYLVYSAAPVTKLRLRDSVAEHPLEVLDYAGRHNHNELATEAARLSMGLPVAQAARTLAPEVLTKWVRSDG